MNIKAIKEAINYTYDNSKLERFYFFIIILLCTGLYFMFIDTNYIIGIPILVIEIVLVIIFCNEINNRYKENLNNIIYLPDGHHIIYNKYAKTKEHLNLKSGKRDGVFEEYYNNDQIKIKCFYVNGILEGDYEEYYDNGQLKIKSFYDKPLPLPEAKKFGPEDTFTLDEWREETFRHMKNRDNQKGIQYYYNEEGVLIQKSNFLDNKMISFEEYYRNGKLRMVNLGERYCYYSEFNKKTCEITIDNKTLKPKGVWINYDKDEIIDYELNFDSNNENGNVLKINYDKSGNTISLNTVRFDLSEYFNYYILDFYCDSRFKGKGSALLGNSRKPGYIEITLDPISDIDDFRYIKNETVYYFR